MPNRLAREASPYLLQHAENPVDWYPWGEEAFEKARREDKPIFLSVGYSTCHWCHVMEHESFEDPDIARILNEHFVAIKVDREERPDVDRVYMTFVQATTGSGGWPLSVWLTPDLKPFYGGTYFPPTSRWGRPGFKDVLVQIARAWGEQRAQLLESADAVMARLQVIEDLGREAVPTAGGERRVAGPEALAQGIEEFARAFDRRYGGFGGAPKFPRPAEVLFLLRAHRATGDARALEMARATLEAMARGGIYDHVGGGFHRYAVDEEWRVPHFEKMLYDQAQLVLAYLEASQAIEGAPGERFAEVARETLEYVERDLTGPEGSFYSAEDADSLPPEHAEDPAAEPAEGAFYLWTGEEIKELFGEDADVVEYRFGIRPEGNAPHDPHGEFRGKNILYVAREPADVARLTGRTEEDVRAVLARVRPVLVARRAGRPRPQRDDKILAGWNGLMIAAFARAARVLGPRSDDGGRRYREMAQRAARFLRERLWDERRRVLLRRYRDGHAAIDGFCEDYAYAIWGLLELFQADGDPAWLEWAIELQGRQDELFWDPVGSGWFSASGQDPSILLRLKEEYDGAEPAPSSVGALNCLALAHLTGDGSAAEKVEHTLARLGSALGRAARVVPFLLSVLAAYHAGLQQIVIVGEPGRADTRALLRAVAHHYLPFAVVVPVEPGERAERLARVLPAIGVMAMREGRATAYVCRGFACQAPAITPEELEARLGAAER